MKYFFLVILLVLSAFFSGSETACFSLDRVQKRRLGRTAAGRRVLKLLSAPERLLSAILLGNTLVNVTASALAASITADCLPGKSGLSLFLAVTSTTFLLLVFGEISPKTIAVSMAEKWASGSSTALSVFMKLVSPLVSLLSGFSRRVVSLLGGSKTEETLSREEVIALVELGRTEGLIGSEGWATLNLLTLNEHDCTDVMKPRSEVAVLRTGWSRERFMETMKNTGYTRYPVLDGPMEKVVGYVDSREFMLCGESDPLPLHPLPSFPEQASLDSVLSGLRNVDEEMGAVFDEYGDWAGIITVHDILDFCLFRPSDSPGSLPPGVTVEGKWLEIPANMNLALFSQLAGRKVEARFAETCGGLLMEATGRIPEEGEEIEVDGLLFRVVEKEGPRLRKLRVRLRTTGSGES